MVPCRCWMRRSLLLPLASVEAALKSTGKYRHGHRGFALVDCEIILPESYAMETTRLSTKGQIIVPKSIRSAKAWGPGTEFTVEEHRDGIMLRPTARFPRTTLDEVVGCLQYTGKPKTLAQMDAAIGKMVKDRHARGRY